MQRQVAPGQQKYNPGYLMTLNENRRVVTKSNERPARKIISATLSNISLFLFSRRMDKNESMQLAINKTMAATVISSMIVFSDLSSSFNEARTIKQMPSKFEANASWKLTPLEQLELGQGADCVEHFAELVFFGSTIE